MSNLSQPFEFCDTVSPEDAPRLSQLFEQCFNGPQGTSDRYVNAVGLENFHILRENSGNIMGALATLPMGQWFGGKRVAMTGIAAVGIAPEYRGTGSALFLMQQTLQELYAKGVAISVLFPATQRLYRKVGYEQGGSLYTWELPTHAIQGQGRSQSSAQDSLPIAAIDPTEHLRCHALQYEVAPLNNGNLDRHRFIWKTISEPQAKEAIYAYLIGNPDQPEGYIFFSQHTRETDSFLKIKDWAALTPAALTSLWTFIASHRSQIHQVQWRGGALAPLTLGLSEQSAKIKASSCWLLRIVNLQQALQQRGYPPHLETELHLDVRDELLPNNGRFILSINKGSATVTPGGSGALQLDIRGLAPLYTSLFTPQQLQLAGLLEGTEVTLAQAAEIFAGNTPWMADFF